MYLTILAFSFAINSAIATEVTIPCWNDVKNQAENVPAGITICRSQLKSCGLIARDAILNIRRNLGFIIAGNYIGRAIDLNLSTLTNPVGETLPGTFCSVVGHNIKNFRTAGITLAELNNQSILNHASCGKEPAIYAEAGKDEGLALEINFQNQDRGSLTTGYMRGVKEWAIKRMAYEYFLKLGESNAGENNYTPTKTLDETKWKNADLVNPGRFQISSNSSKTIEEVCLIESIQGGASLKDLQIAFGKINEKLGTTDPEACNATSEVYDCAVASMNPAAQAYCAAKVIAKQLSENRLEQVLMCQILKDSNDLTDALVGGVLMAEEDVGTVNLNQVDSKVLAEKVFANNTDIPKWAPRWMTSLQKQAEHRIEAVTHLVNETKAKNRATKLMGLAVGAILNKQTIYKSSNTYTAANGKESYLLTSEGNNGGSSYSWTDYAITDELLDRVDYDLCKKNPKCKALLTVDGIELKNIISIPMTAKNLEKDDYKQDFKNGSWEFHQSDITQITAPWWATGTGFLALSIVPFVGPIFNAVGIVLIAIAPYKFLERVHPPDTTQKLRGVANVFERVIVEKACKTNMETGENRCDPAMIEVPPEGTEWH